MALVIVIYNLGDVFGPGCIGLFIDRLLAINEASLYIQHLLYKVILGLS